MATGKALDGKPYAGNPHVRFDEGEVAPAAKPRRGSLLYRIMCGTIFVVAALALGARGAPSNHVFSMSCKVTAVNGDLASAAGRARAIEWWCKHGFSKLWLESYRHGEHVSAERLVEERDAFRAAGFEVCGMITPTMLNDPTPGGEKARSPDACRAAFERAAPELRRLTDFVSGAERGYFLMGADGVSTHEFRKNGKQYVARLNTKNEPVAGLSPHGFELKECKGE